MNRFIEHPTNKIYDLIVIGGGISGAAVAYEAASQGYSVALVEKSDFGAGTSSATSKLIHGGMRYLANFEFGLVRESLKERKTLENIAPNFVYPLAFLLPIKKTGIRRKAILEPGMILYDLLSYDKGMTWDKSKRLPLHRLLSREKAIELEPIIRSEDLTGAITYYDCANFNPERLTLAFIKSAVKYGADVANYARVEDFICSKRRITGILVRDLLTNNTLILHAKLMINCGGPWADILLNIAHRSEAPRHIRRSEGIHIITHKITNDHFAIGGITPTGRPCNLIPWRGHTLIGTTDREYIGDPDHYCVTRERIEDYIAEANASFGIPNLVKYSDVVYAYGGLRPLVDDQTEDVYKTSRKYEIFDHEQDGLPGLITVEGGKYTTSRNLAENVIKTINKKLGRKSRSVSANQYLVGCEIRDLEKHLNDAKSQYREFSEHTVDYLARIYGTELDHVMRIAQSDQSYRAVMNTDGEMLAQVLYAIRHEMACTLPDILLRRTGMGTLGHPGEPVLASIAAAAARELKWSQERIDQEIETANKLLTLPGK
ncbi:MAG: glycerol-3-phosphate dehydrogenase/oxidase [Anaerolineales bacterium]|jgi:glycerol-3-phosphate dehydrogenase|nr:glycerol-3-phosphate dehydrogenase/oxidase [Anaerolineales bacterium]